jgi:hypothetical protein
MEYERVWRQDVISPKINPTDWSYHPHYYYQNAQWKHGMIEVEYACQKAKSNCFKKEVGVNYPTLLKEHEWKYNWFMKKLDQRDPSNRGMLKINIIIICGGK